ncbi:hypothetical protein [Gloeothece verrucosa]|uniref:Contractile injection system tube protein N-terminal domain-containing protein n=1 Tax=Gloeothece verrucosa (strain PCC 7822) TaxID=497965 RepID=E0UAR2_GLOV7|nr:hypothetical protein [Gloeothece verrucosa]ADN13914.1 conserved hypothetical protein [Gloeothece verrucosa PCC 7822]
MVNGNFSSNRNRESNKEERVKKAELYSLDGDDYTFQFMFNPNEISINRKADVTQNRGARTDQEGIPKVSFAHPNATTITINNIIFDVYENQERDLGKNLEKLTKTVKFVQGKDRPPIYMFRWGNVNYLRCYVESVNYQLTLFLPDGSPVRAKASITLKEIDPSFGDSNPSAQATQADRERNSRWNNNQVTNWV